MQCGAVDGSEVVQRALALAQPRAHAQHITLAYHADGALPLVHADGQRLLQVVSGLLDNALRYTPPGGCIRVEVRHEGTTEVVLSVKDTGLGIAPDDLPHIFTRFYRADPTRSRATGGSGLGLAIARGLISAMGGRIWAESVLGSGTSIFIALPCVFDPIQCR